MPMFEHEIVVQGHAMKEGSGNISDVGLYIFWFLEMESFLSVNGVFFSAGKTFGARKEKSISVCLCTGTEQSPLTAG
jgi:hypothetical protein